MACTLSIFVDSSVDKRSWCGYIKPSTVTTISRWVNACWNIANRKYNDIVTWNMWKLARTWNEMKDEEEWEKLGANLLWVM